MTESIFPKTESARDGLACIDAGRCNGFEAAAALASVSPLGMIAMGAFPLSLVGFGKARRWDFDARDCGQAS